MAGQPAACVCGVGGHFLSKLGVQTTSHAHADEPGLCVSGAKNPASHAAHATPTAAQGEQAFKSIIPLVPDIVALLEPEPRSQTQLHADLPQVLGLCMYVLFSDMDSLIGAHSGGPT